jgi:hypothetical protein
LQWDDMPNPLYPWAPTVASILTASCRTSIAGNTLLVASDSGGLHGASRYAVDVYLCVDVEFSTEWNLARRAIRQDVLGDSRRMSYKSLSDSRRLAALDPLLCAANGICGACVAVITNKRIKHLCLGGSDDYGLLHDAAALRARWKDRELEEALRRTHMVSLLVGGLSKEGLNTYWLSDDDNLFGNANQMTDTIGLLPSMSSQYARHRPGDLGVWTASMHKDELLSEDLVAIPDLVAGALSEAANSVSTACGGHVPYNMAVPLKPDLSAKADRIVEWFGDPSVRLSKAAILFEEQRDGRISVSKFELLDSPG